MGSSTIDYDALQRRAMKGIVREALERAIPSMPEGHFFQITFRTQHPEVRLPAHLIEEYPDAMMIRLRVDYWDLEVTDAYFAVGLLFRQQEARIQVPFEAVSRFEDPPSAFSLWLGARSEAPAEPSAKPVESGDAAMAPDGDSADVVSLDAFRRRQD
ncbi:MAG: ClpXP protease specificity-enhancing factor SspB [Myxococcota bacterium]